MPAQRLQQLTGDNALVGQHSSNRLVYSSRACTRPMKPTDREVSYSYVKGSRWFQSQSEREHDGGRFHKYFLNYRCKHGVYQERCGSGKINADVNFTECPARSNLELMNAACPFHSTAAAETLSSACTAKVGSSILSSDSEDDLNKMEDGEDPNDIGRLDSGEELEEDYIVDEEDAQVGNEDVGGEREEEGARTKGKEMIPI
ncbi:hypothetical protein PC113_g21467 [Phytophthora cactorum]|uniref:Uncharacterized protein n=1 Tax=Phytophthora cactorum TaxID=29920 RepID=A0A8T0XZZ8_9STRA|nr:hypothetical protein PC113_g21467 [Phytophthora cactorum]